MGDPLLVRQSLITLIQNACAIRNRAALIAIRPRGPECLVEVWDTGVGIADEEKSKIFSPLLPPLNWRGKSTAPATGWAGWWRALRQTDESEVRHAPVEGKGSRFWMRFTQYSGEDKAPDTAAAYDNTATLIRYAPARRLPGGGRRSLVTSAWESLMSTWGITVRCAASAEEASPLSRTVLRRSPCCATSACAPARAVSTS